METRAEFRRVPLRGLIILYGVRFFIVALILLWAWDLAWVAERQVGDLVSSAGALFTAIWMYCNVIQARYEIQELFVPPFQLTAGWEFLVIGSPCMMGGHFL